MMRHLLIVALLLIAYLPGKPKRYMDSDKVKLEGKQKFVDVMKTIDFRKWPQRYLQTPEIRLDKQTMTEDVEKIYTCEKATGGTDVDLYTTIFIKASDKKNGGRWALVFDAKTNRLIQVIYSKATGGLAFYKS